jgi:hypothetical protein
MSISPSPFMLELLNLGSEPYHIRYIDHGDDYARPPGPKKYWSKNTKNKKEVLVTVMKYGMPSFLPRPRSDQSLWFWHA